MKSDYLFFAAAAAQIAAFSFIGVTSYTAIDVPIGVALVGTAMLFRRQGFVGGRAAWAPLLSLVLVGLTVPLQAVPANDALVLPHMPAQVHSFRSFDNLHSAWSISP